MRGIPFYHFMLVPGVTFFFKGEYFREVAGADVAKGEEVVFLMLREEKKREEIQPEDIYPIGIKAEIHDISQEGDIEIRTLCRVTLGNVLVAEDGIHFDAVDREDIQDLSEEEQEKRLNDLKAAFMRFVADNQWGLMARGFVMQWKSVAEIISVTSQALPLTAEEKYAILETDSLAERTSLMEQALYRFLEMVKVSSEAESALASSNEKLYREDALRKQIEYLQKELDELHPENVSDVRRFEKKIEESCMNDTAKKEAMKVLQRMKHEGHNSSEYGLLYDYLDFVTGLSWEAQEMPPVDLKRAQEILDEDHYGMKKVKDRVLQQIAVMTLSKKQTGSILLFVGAPGTGKTSIGQSIARALGREYVRVSLGGVRDEAEIRGHRRTYIGAMPGRIMDGIKKSGVSNPVMVLDEVDKLSRDFHGDPGSALLEVLDPEQNHTFTDHYMNVPYDLSGVVFVCTANTTETIPEPLLNRMEVIDFPGYTAVEKLQIARRHLLPKAMAQAGIKKANLRVSDAAISAIISDYTMESGVRGLKKRLDTLCRVAAVHLVRGDSKSVTVSPRRLKEFLNDRPVRHDRIQKSGRSGVVTGLAWTRAGGEILFIETMLTKGSGKTLITGQLGDVMKESVQIAISLVKGLYPDSCGMFAENDLHVHVPEGAVPKDGPSAGITLTVALASLVTGKAVDAELAMTGEVSLRGLVMPIGGLTEKLMAAQRAGVRRVLIPAENEADLEEVAAEVRENLQIIPVKTVEEALAICLQEKSAGLAAGKEQT